jgi:hypothetical protein
MVRRPAMTIVCKMAAQATIPKNWLYFAPASFVKLLLFSQ